MKSEHGSDSTLALPFAVVVLQSSLARVSTLGAFSARPLARSAGTNPGLSLLFVDATAGAPVLSPLDSVVAVFAEPFVELWAD
jgi:hypothetical protein